MLKYAFVAMIAVIAAAPDFAAAQTKKGSNGGPIVKSQGHPIEFVRKGQDIVFYVGDDDGSPLPTKDVRGRATIQDGGKTVTLPLTPADPNMMIGKLAGRTYAKGDRRVFSQPAWPFIDGEIHGGIGAAALRGPGACSSINQRSNGRVFHSRSARPSCLELQRRCPNCFSPASARRCWLGCFTSARASKHPHYPDRHHRHGH